jgi:precorrin-2 dehydrogenase/sirohydrochlorin ferrochelatase
MAGFFPMFVRLAGRIVVVVGGGDLAVRTVEALLACGAEVRLITPQPSAALRRFRGADNFTIISRRLQDGDLEDALLALAVDEDPAVNLTTARQGLEWNVLVSVADELALSDFVVPSFVHRGGLTLALHAGILSTVLAQRVADDLEQALGREYGDFIAAVTRAHDRIRRDVTDPSVRDALLQRVIRSDLLDVIRQRGVEAADEWLDSLLAGTDGPIRRSG